MLSSTKIIGPLALVTITALFSVMFNLVYPASEPSHGYFVIEGIPAIFWPIYSMVLFISYYLIMSKKIPVPVKIVAYYILSLNVIIRMFISSYVTGIFGTDSTTFLGLTDYWVSNSNVDLKTVFYGDTPGLFILVKTTYLITALKTKILTHIIVMVWSFLIFICFRQYATKIVLEKHTRSKNIKNKYNIDSIYIILPVSYFLLSTIFVVNYQYAPQTFALILLILSLQFLYNRTSISTNSFIIMGIFYSSMVVLHAFMHIFLILMLFITYFLLRGFNGNLDSLGTRILGKCRNNYFLWRKALILSIIFIIISSIYTLYLTYSLKVSILNQMKNALESTPIEYLIIHEQRVFTPAYREYDTLYLVITYFSYSGLLFLIIYLFIGVMTSLQDEACKVYEISILISAAIWMFINGFLIGNFSLRGGQILLLGLLLLAIRGFIVHKNKLKPNFIIIFILILTVLFNVRLTWYASPPYITDSDVIFANTLRLLLLTDRGEKILSHVGFSGYYNSKFTGKPLTIFINAYTASKLRYDVNEIWILWTNRLIIELDKYGYLIPNYLLLVENRSIVFSMDTAVLFV